MNPEQHHPEPTKTWERKDFDLNLLQGKTPRERAEIETNRDLSKPIEQLVCDYHDMAELAINPGTQNLADLNWYTLQAQKRMVSMMGRVALADERNSKWLVGLTFALAAMTAVLIWLTVVLVRNDSITTASTEATRQAWANYDEQVKRQQDAYDQQAKQSEQQIQAQADMQKRADAIITAQEQLLQKQQDDIARFEKILDGWGNQQKQYQKYLDSLPK